MFSLLWTRCLGHPRSLSLVPQSVRLFSSSSRVDNLTKEEYQKWYLKKKREDPKWYEARLVRIREWGRNRRAHDPRWNREKWNRYQTEKYATREAKARYLYNWCTKKTWVREQLPWRTHTPIFNPQSIALHCTGCDQARCGGSRLFWLTHDSDQYLCNSCYAKRDWTDIMPTGYEDCSSVTEMAARMQQLDGINPKKLP